MKTKKILSMLVAITMLLICFGITAMAEESAVVVAKIGDTTYATLDDALKAAVEDDTITLLSNVELESGIVIEKDKEITLDLAGYTVNYYSTTQGEAMITNKGTLTINDSSEPDTGVINYNYTGAADPNYGKGNYTISNAGTLIVNAGKITIANLSQHAKYPIDNNSTTGDAILVINGGHLYNYNTSAIRQFCNSTTYKNSVTINGGLIEGFSAIWVQNPGKNTVNGSLSIKGGEIKTTAKAYVNGTAELKDVSSAIYCTIAGEGGAWDSESSISITGGTINENVSLKEEAPAAITVDKTVCKGRVELNVKLPTATVTEIENEDLTFALNFKADEVTAEQLAYYGDWYADFVLTINKDFTANADGSADGYLSGQYDAWSENWVDVPFVNTTLEAGTSLRILKYALEGNLSDYSTPLTYKDVYDSVKDFNCGIFFDDEYLAANPDLEVTLELRMYNPDESKNESYVIGETYTFTADDLAAPELPNATVSKCDPLTLTAAEHKYMVWPSGDATIDRPLEIVMNFKANDTLEECLAGGFSDWLVDFNLKFTGLSTGSIIADNCYLAGNYGTFGWIVIPTDGMVLKEGETYPVVSAYDATLNYKDICKSVKDFTAAIHVDQAILDANPNFKVELTLVMTNPKDASQKLTIGEPAIYTAADLKNEEEETLDTKTSYVRNIVTKNANNEDRYQVILFAGIDSLDYDSVGFEITVQGETREQSTKTVYESYTAAGVTYKPTAWGENCKYIFALPINFKPGLKGESVTFRPFALTFEGKQIWGPEKTIDKIYNK